jgi:hypothetical protein
MSGALHSIQVAEAQALPVEAPIGGPLWSVVVPAVLLLVAFGGTFLLYRRFAREARKDRL